MLRTLTTALTLVGILSGTLAHAADGDKAAHAILDKALKAHKASTLKSVEVHLWKAKGTMEMAGQKMTYDVIYSFQLPDKFRFDLSMKAGDMDVKLTAATDGKTAWESMGPMVQEMAEMKAEMFHHQVYTMNVSHLLPLKGKGYKITALDEKKVADKPALGLRIEHKGRPEVRLFFDKESGLLVKSETKIYDEFSGKKVEQETYFTDYSTKDGVVTFGKLTIERAGKPFIVEVLTPQKGLKKANPKLFTMPKGE